MTKQICRFENGKSANNIFDTMKQILKWQDFTKPDGKVNKVITFINVKQYYPNGDTFTKNNICNAVNETLEYGASLLEASNDECASIDVDISKFENNEFGRTRRRRRSYNRKIKNGRRTKGRSVRKTYNSRPTKRRRSYRHKTMDKPLSVRKRRRSRKGKEKFGSACKPTQVSNSFGKLFRGRVVGKRRLSFGKKNNSQKRRSYPKKKRKSYQKKRKSYQKKRKSYQKKMKTRGRRSYQKKRKSYQKKMKTRRRRSRGRSNKKVVYML